MELRLRRHWGLLAITSDYYIRLLILRFKFYLNAINSTNPYRNTWIQAFLDYSSIWLCALCVSFVNLSSKTSNIYRIDFIYTFYGMKYHKHQKQLWLPIHHTWKRERICKLKTTVTIISIEKNVATQKEVSKRMR